MLTGAGQNAAGGNTAGFRLPTRDGVVFVKTPSEAIERITCDADFRVLDL